MSIDAEIIDGITCELSSKLPIRFEHNQDDSEEHLCGRDVYWENKDKLVATIWFNFRDAELVVYRQKNQSSHFRNRRSISLTDRDFVDLLQSEIILGNINYQEFKSTRLQKVGGSDLDKNGRIKR